jgi:hypothetical protein
MNIASTLSIDNIASTNLFPSDLDSSSILKCSPISDYKSSPFLDHTETKCSPFLLYTEANQISLDKTAWRESLDRNGKFQFIENKDNVLNSIVTDYYGKIPNISKEDHLKKFLNLSKFCEQLKEANQTIFRYTILKALSEEINNNIRDGEKNIKSVIQRFSDDFQHVTIKLVNEDFERQKADGQITKNINTDLKKK